MGEYIFIGILILWLICQRFWIKYLQKHYAREVSRHARTIERLADTELERDSILQQFADILHKHNWDVSYNGKAILPSCKKKSQDSEWPELLSELKVN